MKHIICGKVQCTRHCFINVTYTPHDVSLILELRQNHNLWIKACVYCSVPLTKTCEH